MPDEYLRYDRSFSAAFIKRELEKGLHTGLRITCNTPSDRLEDLNFLETFSFLKALSISSVYPYDLSILNKLGNLTALSLIVPKESKIDLSELVHLQALSITWPGINIIGFENCVHIQNLLLVEYAGTDLKEISFLKDLKILEIKISKLQSLEGIQDMKILEQLKIYGSRSLKTIMQVNGLPNLKVLEFHATPKLSDLGTLNNLPGLEVLRLIDVGSIESLAFIKSFPSLKRVSLLGTTVISDGDLTPVNHITEFFYKAHKHYFGYTQVSIQEEILQRNMRKLKKL